MRLACCARTVNRLDSTSKFLQDLLKDKSEKDFLKKWEVVQEFFTSTMLLPHVKMLNKLFKIDGESNKLRAYKRKYRTKIYN